MLDKHPRRVAAIGGGSWIIALVKLLLNNIKGIIPEVNLTIGEYFNRVRRISFEIKLLTDKLK